MDSTSILEKPKESALLKKFPTKRQVSSFFFFQIINYIIKTFNSNFYFFITVIVNYKVELYDPRSGGFMPSSPGIGMHVEVKDPDDKMVLSRVYSAEGKNNKKKCRTSR